VLLAALCGLALGVAAGLFGGGGSVLAVPVLVYLLDQDVPAATTASLVVVAAGALAGMVGHAHKRRVCWRHAGSFTAAALPGIVAGTFAAEGVSDDLLLGAFSLVLLAAAAATWRRVSRPPEPDAPGWEPGTACPPLRLPRDLAAGVLVGFVTGFFGVGGGFLIVPTLAIALAFTLRTAIGTSLAIIAGSSLAGLAVHFAAGRTVEADVTMAMALGCGAGALAGAALAGHVPQRALGRAFAVLVTLVAGGLLAGSVG
jgi:uncharacterized membrane protein YfcA